MISLYSYEDEASRGCDSVYINFSESLHSFQYPRLEIEDRRRRGQQRLDGITGIADMSLSKLR